MGFDNEKHMRQKMFVQKELDKGNKTPYDFMQEYKKCITIEDYETAKAITEVLEPLKHYTSHTHRHIQSLNNAK